MSPLVSREDNQVKFKHLAFRSGLWEAGSTISGRQEKGYLPECGHPGQEE